MNFSEGLSVFYGYHVLTAKLRLSVPSAPGWNAKQLSAEVSASLGEPCVCCGGGRAPTYLTMTPH